MQTVFLIINIDFFYYYNIKNLDYSNIKMLAMVPVLQPAAPVTSLESFYEPTEYF